MAADEGIGYFKRRLVLTLPSMGRVGAHRATGWGDPLHAEHALETTFVELHDGWSYARRRALTPSRHRCAMATFPIKGKVSLPRALAAQILAHDLIRQRDIGVIFRRVFHLLQRVQTKLAEDAGGR